MEDALKFTDKLHEYLKPDDVDSKTFVQFYGEEAAKYDENITCLGSVGPIKVATKLAELIPDAGERRVCKVLDVAAGTGRVGTELAERGFRTMDALEPCREMLDLLIKKDIYSKTYCQFFAGGTAFEAADGSYDAVVINGAFVKGHLPVDALREIARVLKKGGFFVTNNTREMYSDAYDAQIDAEMNQMAAEGCWKIVAKEDYVNRKDVTGVIYAIQRL